MKHHFLFLISCIAILQGIHAQSDTVWHHKKCAVVLTYDDAINQHLDNAVPVLDSLNLKATFYITAFSKSIQTRLNDWKKLPTNGHELGNHTLFHPCIGGAGREWVSADYDMTHYSIKRMLDETKMTNVFLEALDGKKERTFAFTCGDMKIGDSSFINSMKNDFVAARAVRNEMHTIDKIDLYNIDCFAINNNTAAEIIEWVKQAEQTHSLLVILFHGVGGGNSLNISVEEHSKFLHYLKQNEKNIWITTMIDAAEYIKNYQAKNK